MANALSIEEQDKIRNLFIACRNIRAVARTLGFSKNTVKKLLRADGLTAVMPVLASTMPVERTAPEFEAIDFSILEKLFELGREHGETLDFQKHIKAIADSITKEIGIKGTIDKIRLESAITQYIAYRRFYLKSLHCSDKRYTGSFSKSHEKLATAVNKWIEVSNKALDQFNRLIRELEVKYGKRSPDLGRGNLFVQNQQVNLTTSAKDMR